jgi:hypothetical protein
MRRFERPPAVDRGRLSLSLRVGASACIGECLLIAIFALALAGSEDQTSTATALYVYIFIVLAAVFGRTYALLRRGGKARARALAASAAVTFGTLALPFVLFSLVLEIS